MRSRQPGWSDPRGRHLRRRPSRRLLLFVLLVPLLSGLFAAPGAQVANGDDLSNAQAQKTALQKRIAAQKDRIAELAKAQAGLRTEIAGTTVQLQGITTDLKAMRAKVDTMKTQIAQVQATYDDLVFQVSQLDRSIDLITDQESEKSQELATRRALLAQRIRSAYDTDRTSILETFLSGGSFTDVLTQVSYYLDVGHQDKELAQQIASDQATLATLHDTVVQSRADTDDLRAETAVQKAALDQDLVALKQAQAQLKQLEIATAQALAAQKHAYQQLAKSKAAAKKALAAAAAAQKRLQDKINKLVQEQYQHGHIPSAFNGTLRWPMAGSVSQDFGCTGLVFEPPLGSCPHFHQGIDIVAPYGTPVHSSGAGTVVYCGWNYADGADPAWIVIVAHSQKLETWYAHMIPGCPVHAGGSVKAGAVIGHEGNTGHSTGAHLHWAVRYDGTFVNPRLFL